MRFGYALIAGSLVLAWAVGSASSQAPKQGTTVAPPAPTAIRDLRVRPTEGIRVSVPVTTVQGLTADECKALGGEVQDDNFYKVCASEKVCIRTDNFGKTHAVCLTAS
jgi:hypothetical protein